MNIRIVIHLLKTDWLRLRWLLLACWAVLLLASWPALSFSPGNFDMPVSAGFMRGGGDPSFSEALEKHGLFSSGTVWFFITLERVALGLTLVAAGCLGFHSRMWSEGRPVRRRESLLAKTASLLLFLILPLALLAMAEGLLQGVPPGQALAMGATRAGENLPALLGVMLFGAYCGNWWAWLIGTSGIFVAGPVLKMFRLTPGPNWFSGPFQVPDVSASLYLPKLWIAVAVLAILLPWVRRDLPAVKRVGIALLAIFAACQLARYFEPAPQAYRDPLAGLPDWSTRLHPGLDAKSLEASVDGGVIGRGPQSHTLSSFDSESYMNLLMPWKTGGLAADSYVNWSPVGSSLLKDEDSVVSRTPENDSFKNEGASYYGEADEHALTAVVKPEGGKLRWDGPSHPWDSHFMGEVFTPLEPGVFSELKLEMNLKGTIVQLEKIVDVPLGKPVTVMADGLTLHIRRLDLENFMPLADVCYVTTKDQSDPDFARRLGDWIPVIYFPGQAMARVAWGAMGSTMPLAPGLTAIRCMYHTAQFSIGRAPDLRGYDEARFILMKRRYVATATAEIHTPPLPFTLRSNRQDPKARDNFDPPAFNRRPDPATTSPQQFEQWMKVSYSSFDTGWGGRNLADYVPRYLDRILRRRTGIHPPSSPEGRALEAACPESRRREVIDALLPASRGNDANWIPDLLIRRGWVDEAKPEILQMLADDQVGNNVFSQLMVASLEDPQTYPELLQQKYWLETYQQLRLLPGIEPQLTEAITRNYREAQASLEGQSADAKFHIHLIPAAHGMPEALGPLIEEWLKVEPDYRATLAEYVRQVIQLPGQPDDWRAAVGALTGRKASDFRYDPLARLWVPITAP